MSIVERLSAAGIEPKSVTWEKFPDRWWEPVHITTLESMARCPAVYRVACLTTDTDSPVYRIGRAFHSLALGRGDQVVVYQGRRDARQQAWRDFQEDNGGRIILSESEAEVAVPLAQAVRDNALARELIDRCDPAYIERTITGEILGFPVEGTPDAVGLEGKGLIIDLKSARWGEPGAFQRGGAKRGYLAQVDWYAELLGMPEAECFIISADKSCPIAECVTVHRITPEAREQGRKCWRGWLEMLRTCVDSDSWPGYALGVVDWKVELEVAEPAADGESWEPEGDAA